MKIALAGLGLSGKTTLFDAMSHHVIDSAAHPSRADHPNVAAVKIPDERVDWLAKLENSKKKVFGTMELVDLPGIVMGGDPGAAERPRVLAHLRQADAIVYCLRAFASSAVPPQKGSVDPRRDYNDLRSEFLISDLDSVMRRVEKVEATMAKPLPKKEQERYRHELDLLTRCQQALESEQSLRPLLERSEDKAVVSSFGFLTQKPAIIVLNIGEQDIGDPQPLIEKFADTGLPLFAICAQAESDILQLPEEERPAFLEDLGLRQLQSSQLVHDIFKSLDDIVFLTSGPDEARAWPLAKGSTAVEAAGTIHSDLARGFIRAEVIAYDDLHAAGSEKAVRAAGKFRLEGKDYIVQDGDVLVIRFSV
jgi:GTP-binding protein YchF